MKRLKLITIVFLVCIMMSLTACGGSDNEHSSATGSLSLLLTDAATNEYEAVYVTIEEVRVCTDDENEEEDHSWYTVAEPEGTYNLLELVNGVQEQLGVTPLEAGHYTQMRLIIGEKAYGENHPFANYIIDDENEYHELKIPSGIQTGIKLVSGFEIYEGQITELILDFDAARSVVKAGNSGKWLLKPVIKVIGIIEGATISGIITDGENVLEDVLVSAQFYDVGDDKLVVQASTQTDENGEYFMFVEPNIYNVVAYKEAIKSDDIVYAPKCKQVDAQPNFDYDVGMTLDTVEEKGTLEGQVSVETETEDASVSISIQQSIDCEGGGTTQIEIISLNIADGGNYSIDLPAPPAVESYQVVSDTEGYESQSETVVISEGATTTHDIIFE